MSITLRAAIYYFVLVFALGFMLGTVRSLWLAPALGELAAVLLELPVMLGAAWFICARLTRGLGISHDTCTRLVMGLVAFTLLLAAELALSLTLVDNSLEMHLATYRSAAGVAGLIGQLLFALFPVIQR